MKITVKVKEIIKLLFFDKGFCRKTWCIWHTKYRIHCTGALEKKGVVQTMTYVKINDLFSN